MACVLPEKSWDQRRWEHLQTGLSYTKYADDLVKPIISRDIWEATAKHKYRLHSELLAAVLRPHGYARNAGTQVNVVALQGAGSIGLKRVLDIRDQGGHQRPGDTVNRFGWQLL